MWSVEQGQWYPAGHPELIAIGIVSGNGAYLRPTGSLSPPLMEETPFPSIIHSFWYVVVTITTVGYGDAAPASPVGKLIGSVTILTGVVVMAMSIGVIGSNFSVEYNGAQ